MEVRSRMLATSLLVLVALGGAGLAVAADRQQTETSRPEVTWSADNAARPYVEKLAADLSALSSGASDLAKAGRLVLGSVQTLNLDATRTAVDDGDAHANAVAAALDKLTTDRADAAANIAAWRVGAKTSAQLEQIATAAESAANLVPAWSQVKSRASTVAGLVDDLQRHDGLVFRATTAGRQGNWADAISTLAEAGKALDAAREIRNSLGAGSTVDTLDQVMARYTAYDSALSALYEYLGSGGQQSGDQFDTLSKAVDVAQAALPTDAGIFSVIVSEAAGTHIADALVELEQARGDINAALDAMSDDAAQ